jgi:ergothioneine biosynthesis protein EgtB
MFNKPISISSPRQGLIENYRHTRQLSCEICRPLEPEDFIIQAMPDASPPKWHLAHTTWFFETFILLPFQNDYRIFHPQFPILFNSYYETVGEFHPRSERGNLARPTITTVSEYRRYVDDALCELIMNASADHLPKITELVEIGLHHEQQHQELMLMDIKYNFFKNPLYPAYLEQKPASEPSSPQAINWLPVREGLYEIGARGDQFCYDNELGRHKVYLESFSLANRLVSNEEFLEFIADDGYRRVELWLSEGWDWIHHNQIQHPLYWVKERNDWLEFTLHGLQPLNKAAPVLHVSYFEADAYARWRGLALPTEKEWEAVAGELSDEGQYLSFQALHPEAARPDQNAQQFFGNAWEWTMSSYAPYPRFTPRQGSLGEYNGKFMSNQYVLRGGACITPPGHIRPSYRNFFPTSSRWMFSSIRLKRED